MARVLYRVGIPDSRTNLIAFRTDIQAVLTTYLGKSLDQVDAASLLSDLFDLAVRYRIRVPKDYALLSRAAISVEGWSVSSIPSWMWRPRRSPVCDGP